MRLTVPKNAGLVRLALAAVVAVMLAGCGSAGSQVQGTATSTLTKASLTTRTMLTTSGPGPLTASERAKFGTVKGQVDLCGGRKTMPCHLYTGRISGCENKLCSRLNEVAVVAPARNMAVVAPLRNGRFSLSLKPGAYTVKLLRVVASRGKLHGQEQPSPPSETQSITVAAGQTRNVVFKLYAG
jgi:hypothetical protein